MKNTTKASGGLLAQINRSLRSSIACTLFQASCSQTKSSNLYLVHTYHFAMLKEPADLGSLQVMKANYMIHLFRTLFRLLIEQIHMRRLMESRPLVSIDSKRLEDQLTAKRHDTFLQAFTYEFSLEYVENHLANSILYMPSNTFWKLV